MSKKTCKNYYDILGVTPDSENADVKTAYHKLARELHPDVNKNPDCVQKFKDVIEAYQTLSNEKKRQEYDMINGFYKTPKSREKDYGNFDNIRKSPDKDTFEKQKDTSEKTVKAQTSSNREKEIYKEYVRESNIKSSLNSILDEIAKKHFQKKSNAPSLKNGQDIRTDVEIDLKEAKTGTQRVLNILHKELCPHCKGHRFINGNKCKACNGTGEFEIKKKITVTIPQGVKNNAILRLKGEGNPGFFGGTDGNLYINIKIKENTNIQFDGNNILYKLSLSPFDAVLGTTVEIKDFSEKIKLTIPPMTKSGQKFRLANQGMQTKGKFGDMIVTVEIQLAEKLSKEEISLYEKLRKVSNSLTRE